MSDERKIIRHVEGGRMAFWCAGCGDAHMLKGWDWNGSEDKPTFKPSILVGGACGPLNMNGTCHSYVTDGSIQYLPDSTHALANKTVPLEPF